MAPFFYKSVKACKKNKLFHRFYSSTTTPVMGLTDIHVLSTTFSHVIFELFLFAFVAA